MEAANILYGVTMQEKGVSKLLSLHIDDVAEIWLVRSSIWDSLIS